MRLRTPLSPAVEYVVAGKDGADTTCVVFDPRLAVKRELDSPAFVDAMLRNQTGKVMSPEEESHNRVPHRHLTSIATEPHRGRREGILDGKIAASSSLFGLDTLAVATAGAAEVQVAVGDTVMVMLPGVGGGTGMGTPCRLVSVFWRYSSPFRENEDGRLVAQVNPLSTTEEAACGCGPRDAADPLVGVWEVTNHGDTIEVDAIMGRVNVVAETEGAGMHAKL
ncbi:unnamed protein product [Laminaria digitata]